MGSTPGNQITFDDKIPRWFMIATIFWGVVGMFVGVIVAIQLFWPPLNFEVPWLTFGRLRPLHTNAVIFAFCGNAIFAGIYHSSQRLLKARMFSDTLSKIHFWGWQLIIVLAAITLPLGFITSKEYAELEWPVDLAITAVWVVFSINFFGTVAKRRERILYVSIWFYMATIITIAMLHIVNSLAIPYSPMQSYSIYSGVQDALIQWWYGHNAVAFFLTTPFLGLAYYYIPKACGKPIYSYKLSIIHFWSLIFIYIWAGPHHLQYSALPDWLQSLGMVFSVMLVAPSWGGAINFILTLRMAWDKVRKDPILKFFGAGTTFYMMATLEGPLLSIKSVNALAHATDWVVGHVHSGALGWNGFIVFGMLYYAVPKLYNREIAFKSWVNIHFWLGTIGILLYIVSMWISGITQGLMLQQMDTSGILAHPNYIEIVTSILPLHMIRAAGGLLYLAGVIMCFINIIRTIQLSSTPSVTTIKAEPISAQKLKTPKGMAEIVESFSKVMIPLTIVAVVIGGVLEIVPMFLVEQKSVGLDDAKILPYTPLEIEGRDIYIREGCNNCHTQMVRPLIHETQRYGKLSKANEYKYDHPHLWGSKRTGPDLWRVGQKYGHLWHWKHMINPRSLVSGSIMPAYPWLAVDLLDTSRLQAKLTALKSIGVPYAQREIDRAVVKAKEQAIQITLELKNQGAENVNAKSELVALIAYLQRLGVDGRAEPTEVSYYDSQSHDRSK